MIRGIKPVGIERRYPHVSLYTEYKCRLMGKYLGTYIAFPKFTRWTSWRPFCIDCGTKISLRKGKYGYTNCHSCDGYTAYMMGVHDDQIMQVQTRIPR